MVLVVSGGAIKQQLMLDQRSALKHLVLHTSKLYVRPSKLTFMTAGALAPHVGVSAFFQSGSVWSQNSQCVSRLHWFRLRMQCQHDDLASVRQRHCR